MALWEEAPLDEQASSSSNSSAGGPANQPAWMSAPEEQEVQPAWMSAPEENNDQPGPIMSAIGSFAQAAGRGVSDMPKSFAIEHGEIQQALLGRYNEIDSGQAPDTKGIASPSVREYQTATPERRATMRKEAEGKVDPREYGSYKLGEDIDKFIAEKLATNPEYEEQFWLGKVPAGLGSMVDYVAAGIAATFAARSGRLPPGLASGGGVSTLATKQSSVSGFEDALSNGASLEDAYTSSNLNEVMGFTEAVPIARILDRIDKGSGGIIKRGIIDASKAGTEEAIQELSQTIYENMVASDFVQYDKERGLITGTGDAAGVGFTTGALVQLLGSMVAGRRGGRLPALKTPEQKTAETTEKILSTETVEDAIQVASESISPIQTESEAFNAQDELTAQAEQLPDSILPENITLPEDVSAPVSNDQRTLLEPTQPDINAPTGAVLQGEGIQKPNVYLPEAALPEQSVLPAEVETLSKTPLPEDDLRTDTEKRVRVDTLKQTLASIEKRISEGESSPQLLTELMSTARTLHTELTTDSMTGLPNLNGFKEHVAENPTLSVLFDDLDDFKGYNTDYGHQGVDEYVFPHIGKIKQEVASETGVTVFRRSGDEFLATGTPEQLAAYGAEVQKRLGSKTVKIKRLDGTIIEHKGIGVSYGIGQDETTAEIAADQQKEQRKAAGLRTGERDAVSTAGQESGLQDSGDQLGGQRIAEDTKPVEAAGITGEPVGDGSREGIPVGTNPSEGVSKPIRTLAGKMANGKPVSNDIEKQRVSVGTDLAGANVQAESDLLAELDSGQEQAAQPAKKPKSPTRKLTAKQAVDRGLIEYVSEIDEFNDLVSKRKDYNGETLSELKQVEPTKQTAEKPAESKSIEELAKEVDKVVESEKAAVKKIADEFETKKETANTEDVGEELYANKRGNIRGGINWADVENLNDTLKVKEVTKAKVWPKPNYQELVDSGMPEMLAHYLKRVYDSISTLPASRKTTDADMQLYIDTLNEIREGFNQFVANKPAVAAYAKALSRHGSKEIKDAADAYSGELDPEFIINKVFPAAEGSTSRFRGEGLELNNRKAQLIGGNKPFGAMQMPGYSESRKMLKDLESGWPAKQEMWKKRGLTVIKKSDADVKYDEWNGRHRVSIGGRAVIFNLESKAEADKLVADMKDYIVLDKRRNLVDSFASEESAIEGAKKAVAPDRGKGIAKEGVEVTEAIREGKERREDNRDVTTQELLDTFGLRGINFGNWMKGKSNAEERQLHTNHAYDALLDLAEILQVPPKALSLNGMLGIAIGAQGNGRNAAHFVPGVNEINLTRTQGAGSLAHEWGHALDHYFAVQAGMSKASEPFLTEVRYSRLIEGSEIRKEISDSFANIVETMNKRDITEEELAQQNEQYTQSTIRRLTQWIEYVGKKVEEGDKSLSKDFDKLADKMKSGDLGEGYKKSGNKQFPEVIADVRELVKKATGRLLSIEDTSALSSNATSYQYQLKQKDATEDHVPQKVRTTYAKKASAKDAKKQKPYWSTNVEKFARAFESYVLDTLTANAARNDYLVDYGKGANTEGLAENTDPMIREIIEGTESRYPQGRERQEINSSFDKLIDSVETKETDKGIALYSQEAVVPEGKLTLGISKDSAQKMADDLMADVKSDVKVVVHQTQKEATGKDEIKDSKGRAVKVKAFIRGNELHVVAKNLNGKADLESVIRHEVFWHYGFSLFDGKTQKEIIGKIESTRNDKQHKETWDYVEDHYGDETADVQAQEFMAKLAESKKGRLTKVYHEIIAMIQKAIRAIGWEGKITQSEIQALLNAAERNARRGEQGLSGYDLQPAYSKTMEAAEKQSAIEKGLPMDKESRLARAREMGFDTDTVYYHGTRREFNEFEAMKPMGAIGNPVGVYFTKDKRVAEEYAMDVDGATDEKSRIVEAYLKDPILKENSYSGDEYYVTDSSNIRSTNAAFNPDFAESANILYSKTSEEVPVAFKDWNLPDVMAGHYSDLMTKKEKLMVAGRQARRKLQDKFVVWKSVQEQIGKTGGKMSDFSDAYNKFTLVEGKIGDKFKTLFDDYIQPIISELTSTGLTIEQLGEYLYAHFAPQRNARIAEINPDIQEGGSGMTDAEAKKILDGFTAEQTNQLESMAQKVYAMQKYKLDVLVESGRITADLRDELLKDDRYVPLKGFADTSDLITNTEATGRGFDQSKDAFKRAKGRRSLAGDIFSTSVRDVENAVISAEKNRVGQSVLKLVLDNPNKNIWKVNPIKIQKAFNSRSGQVEQRVISDYKALARDPNVFVTWVNGKPYAIEFTDNPNGESALARAVKNMGIDNVPQWAAYLAKLNRWLSYANTALSPEFLLTNPIRDIQTALAKAHGDYDAKISGNVIKNLPKAMRGAAGGIGESKAAKKIADLNPKWTAYYNEYAAEGGKTDYFRTKTVSEMKSDLESELSAAAKGTKGAAIRSFRALHRTIENGNAVLENMTRLSMFITLREAGYSSHQAATASKNLTVNFNRKGEAGALINSLYLFYNASMQGAHLTLALMRNPKVQKLLVAAGAGMVALTQYNILMGGDDDDGEPNYFKLQDYEKERNIIIMWPDGSGRYSKFPLPYGLNVPMNAAAAITHVANGRDPVKESLWLAGSAWNSFSPVGENGWNIIAPTVFDPFVDIALNRNYADRKIMPDDNPYEDLPTPNSQKAFASTHPYYKKSAELLNELTGGNKQKPGFVDISPESIQHLTETYTGAAGGFINRVTSWATNPDFDRSRAPFLRKFYGEKSPYTVGQKYRENKENTTYIQERAEYLRAEAKKNPIAMQSFLEFKRDNIEGLKLARVLDMSEKHLTKLYKQRKRARELNKTDIADKADKAIKDRQGRFNKMYNDIYLDGGIVKQLGLLDLKG